MQAQGLTEQKERKWKRCFLVACGALLLTLHGCYYDKEEELYPNSFCDTVNYTYSGTVSPILLRNCATPGCHVAGGDGPYDFTRYSEVQESAEDGTLLFVISGEQPAMPPVGYTPLRDCEVKQIDLWIRSGAPEN